MLMVGSTSVKNELDDDDEPAKLAAAAGNGDPGAEDRSRDVDERDRFDVDGPEYWGMLLFLMLPNPPLPILKLSVTVEVDEDVEDDDARPSPLDCTLPLS